MRVLFGNFALVLASYFNLGVSIVKMKNKIQTFLKSLVPKNART